MSDTEHVIAANEGQPVGSPSLTLAGETEELPRRGLARFVPRWFRILWENNKSRAGLIMLAVFVLTAIFAPLITTHDPSASVGLPNEKPSSEHWLGTTQAGEDVYSKLIYGSRVSLTVGFLAGGLVTIISVLIGLTAGYVGGIVDDILSFFINLMMVVPTLPLIITVAAYSPVKGLLPIILILGFTGWAWGARTKRAQVLSLREREFITAAIFAGEPTWRIIVREIMPNMTSLIVAAFIGAAAGAIGAEAGLQFIGVGDLNSNSWGTMLYWANNSGAMLTGQWGWLIAPGLALALLMTALTLINFGIDALSNPHLREE
jgi:peptide/nickel transport system permease protein